MHIFAHLKLCRCGPAPVPVLHWKCWHLRDAHHRQGVKEQPGNCYPPEFTEQIQIPFSLCFARFHLNRCWGFSLFNAAVSNEADEGVDLSRVFEGQQTLIFRVEFSTALPSAVRILKPVLAHSSLLLSFISSHHPSKRKSEIAKEYFGVVLVDVFTVTTCLCSIDLWICADVVFLFAFPYLPASGQCCSCDTSVTWSLKYINKPELRSSFLFAVVPKLKQNLRKLSRNASALGKVLVWCFILKWGAGSARCLLPTPNQICLRKGSFKL